MTQGERVPMLARLPPPQMVMITNSVPGVTRVLWLLLVLFSLFHGSSTAQPVAGTAQSTSESHVPEGLTKSDWTSIRAAYEAGRHQFFKQEDGSHVASNPGLGWKMEFDARGFTAKPKDGTWEWGLELQRDADTPVCTSSSEQEKSTSNTLQRRLTPAITEWFINDPRGLEQGWTLSAPAEIRLRIRGNLKPAVSPQSVRFGDQITYSGLKAWDATGKVVPTHFEATAEGFAVRYDDTGAQYPLTIDPIAQQAYLKPAAVGTTQAGDNFGGSVAISGDTVVVGARYEDGNFTGVNSTVNDGTSDYGAAYVFVRSGATWSQQAYLKASQVTAGDQFGYSVAISGDTVVVGSLFEDGSTAGVNGTVNETASDSGAAYVFVRNGTTWTQQAYLKAGQVTGNDQFGYSVAVSGETVVIGAPFENGSAAGVNGTVDEGAADAGAAFVFVRNGTVWSQQAYLKASEVTTLDFFGRSVAVAGDTVVVGANGEDGSSPGVNGAVDEAASAAGAAYVFVRNGTTWTQEAYLKASQVNDSDAFGVSVAVSSDTIVVGSPGEDSSATGINQMIDEGALGAGAAYVFVRTGTIWSQQAYLKPAAVGTTQAGDDFGRSVAVDGDTVVVGASLEDGGIAGVNGTPNQSRDSSGAAYVFTRGGTTWVQQAYLKASQVSSSDQFGSAVAIAGGTVVVGALGEDGSATGVNGTENESAADAGAAYVFTGLGPAPEIAVEHPAATNLADGGATIDFGTSALASAGVTKTFTIRNLGILDLTGLSVTKSGLNTSEFVINTTGMSTTLAYGASTTFSVTFTPSLLGNRSAVLQIASNDDDETPFEISLSGVGTGSGAQVISFSSASDIPITANGLTATGSTLDFTLNFAPPTGSNLTVVNNTERPFIQGAFSNLAQGQTVNLSYGGVVYPYVANYYGGTGNDLVLVWKNNRAYAWGSNSSNQLGVTVATPLGYLTQPTPVDDTGVLAGKTIISLAGSYEWSLALCSDGTVAAWGKNDYGQLGINSVGGTQSSPVLVNTAQGVSALYGKTVIAITASSTYTCMALCSDGTIASWGRSNQGQLGNGTTIDSSVPVAVQTIGSALSGKTVVAIASGTAHNLALCSDGTIAAWGAGTSGPLGNGSTGQQTTPYAVTQSGPGLSGKSVIAIAAGYYNSYALCSDGTISAWGINGTPNHLGDGSTSDQLTPVAVNTASGFSALYGKSVTAIATGAFHCRALCSDGTLTAWNINGSGQLGDNTTTKRMYPVLVNVAIGTSALYNKTVTSIVSSRNCSYAICSDGTVTSWGGNVSGQLGDNSTTQRNAPVLVDQSTLLPGERMMAVFSGTQADHALAVVAEPLAPEISIEQPVATDLTDGAATFDFGSTAVASAGVTKTCMIRNLGTLDLTGLAVTKSGINSSDFVINTTGMSTSLAPSASTTFTVTFNPMQAGSRSAALQIASNDADETPFDIALTGAGNLVTSFSSKATVPVTSNGFTATGSTVNLTLNYAPTTGDELMVVNNTSLDPINGTFSNLANGQTVTLTYGGVNYEFVAYYYGGEDYNDLVLLWKNRRLLAWGYNNSGQLGDNSVTTRNSLVLVNNAAGTSALAGKDLVSIATGESHSLALCTDGTVIAWGRNSGELGDNTTTSRSVPVAVNTEDGTSALFGKRVVAISAGGDFSMALCSDGTVVTWGSSEWGQLGIGISADSRKVPVAVSTVSGQSALFGKKVARIATGTEHCLALTTDGILTAWGGNAYGQVGDTTNTFRTRPVLVNTDSGTSALFGKTAKLLACGQVHNLVVCTDGTLVSWGSGGARIGDNTTTQRTAPVMVNVAEGVSALFGKIVAAISAGERHSVALCSDGVITAWGDNGSRRVTGASPAGNDYLVPVLVDATSGVSALLNLTPSTIYSGYDHNLALCTNGSLVAWGGNMSGEIGIGSFVSPTVPVLVSTASLTYGERFVAAATGFRSQHNLAIVAAPPPFPEISVNEAASGELEDAVGAMDFGTTLIHTAGATKTFTIQNIGGADLTGLNVTKSGVNASEYVLGSLGATTLAPGASTTFTVSFMPTSVGAHVATVQITSNDGDEAPFDITLNGNASGALAADFTSGSQIALTTNGFTATGSTVTPTLGYAPAPFTVLTLVDNTSANPINGTFTNLAQGQTVTLVHNTVSYKFFADYFGGNGNDLVLVLQGPGVLDYSFGSSGKAMTDVENKSNGLMCAKIQTDGKIVAAGNFQQTVSNGEMIVARYLANGSLDASFSGNGHSVIATEHNDLARDIAIQADGKILVAVQSAGGIQDEFTIVRYNSDGTVDTAFGDTGIVRTSMSTNTSFSSAIAIQDDGKIVVAGAAYQNSWDFALARYLPNGTLDLSFNGTGKVVTEFFGGVDYGWDVAIQTDGKIVVAGQANNGTNDDFAVARYNSDGSPDLLFNGTGRATAEVSTGNDMAFCLSIQADERLVLGGKSDSSGGSSAIFRFNSNGLPDSSFGNLGKVETDIGTGVEETRDIAITPDGKILAAGRADSPDGFLLSLLRYNSAGGLDSGFHGGGVVTTRIGSATNFGRDVEIQDDGKVVVVGSAGNGSDVDFAVARYLGDTNYNVIFTSETMVPMNADGFSATGQMVSITLGFSPAIGTELTLVNNTGTSPIAAEFTNLANGATVPLVFNSVTYNFIANYTGGTGNDLTLLLPGPGALDFTFNGNGKTTTGFGAGNDGAHAVVVQPDGKIVALGASGNYPEEDFALARYNANGTLDTSFNGTGKITLGLAQNDVLEAVALQNDGKIVAVGYTGSTTSHDFAVLRYNSDGTPDTSFNGNGRVITAVISDDLGYGVVVQSDGRIVVAGTAGNDFAVVRYNTNGSLDTSFNGSGIATTSFVAGYEAGSSLALQSDGKIVVAGYAHNGANYDFALARFHANGTLDTSFNGTGKVITAIGSANDSSYFVAVQPNGKILLAGYTTNGSADDAALVRYNTDGSLDTSFGGTGKIVTDIGTGDDAAHSLALTLDGKILAGGYATTNSNADFALLRYNTNGTLDSSFGNGGKITTVIGSSNDKARAMALQTDGNVVLAGSSFNGSDDDFALARYTLETTHDAAFASETSVPLNANGFTATGHTVNLTLGFAPSLGTELRLLNNTGLNPITGAFSNIANGATVPLTFNSITYNFIANYSGGTGNDLTLLLPGPGGLDYTFNGSGRVMTNMKGAPWFDLYGLVVQNNGCVIVGSGAFNGSDYDFGLTRYLANGTIDTTFNGTGSVLTTFGSTHDYLVAMALQSDGKVVAVGQSYTGSNPVYLAALARYNPDGSLDTSFNSTGKVLLNIGGVDDRFFAVAIQPDGKIVAAGVAHQSLAIVRFNTNGSLDTSFNSTGKLITSFGGSENAVFGLTIQPDGKIIAAGTTLNASYDFAVLRCLPNGALDPSFNGTGKAVTDFSNYDLAYSVVLQPDGKIILAGTANYLADSSMALARYNPDGSLDTSFNGSGKVTTNHTAEADGAIGVALQSDGKILAGGFAGGDFATSRYNVSGTLDASFHADGTVIVPVGNGEDKASDIAVLPDGRIILSGYAFNGSDFDYAAVRLTTETVSNVTFTSSSSVPLNANGFDATGQTLNVTLGFTPNPGTRLRVLNNTSLQPISGEFENLAHGQALTLGGSIFVANYFGGDGNDLTLEWANTKLVAFGSNANGQLGTTGTAAQANVPTQVVATAPIYQKTILSMSAGQTHSLAVCSDGTVAAWGGNSSGQLGTGSTTSATMPVAVTMSGVLNGKKVIAVAAGGQHSLALCSDGTLAAWGDGSFGQIGDNGSVDRTAPVLVSTAGALSGKRVIAISAGATHSAALCSDGTVVCWGDNANGELGNANNTRSLVPVAVSTSGVLLGHTVTAIACGQNHTLALLADGAVAAWGANASKQLGNNSITPSNVPVLVDASGLLNGKRVVEIAAGGQSSLAICSDGILAAWGLNDRGQLGVNSATTTFGMPQAVVMSGVLNGKTVTGIEMSQNHAAALCSDGSLATWGAGTGGQLGNNAVSDSLVPVAVNGAILGGTDFFVSAASGAVAGHSLAVIGSVTNAPLIVVESPVATLLSDSTSNQIVFGTTLPGTVKTRVVTIRNTGTQTLSGLGVTITGSGANPSNFSISTPPAATLAPGDATSFTLTFAPSTIGSKTIVLEIASNIVGTANTFSIGVQGTVLNTLSASYTTGQEIPAAAAGFTASGKMVNFSLNYAPQTGTMLMVVNNTGAAFISGAFSNLTHGQVVTLTNSSITYNFVANYFGGDGNDLVLHWASTRLLAWGANSTGTLGNNSTTPALTPVAVTATGVLNGKTILSVASGEHHSLAVCSDGALAAWGANNAGQLGDATNNDRLVPVLVSAVGALNGKKVIAAAAGYDFSIALCSDGTLVTFGENNGGQLGNNSTTPSNVPVTISSTAALSGKAVVSIAAGYDFGLASCSDGTVVAWGQNAYGQFGNNTINNSLVPAAATTSGVLTGKTVRSVAAGNFHSLAICTDGTLAGWGDNSFGELGDGTNDASLLPVLVTSSGALVGKTPVQVAASMLHSAALCSDGTVVTWGDNSFGQLGLIGLESSFSPVIAASGGVMNGRVAGFLGGGQMHHVISVTDGYPAAWGVNSSGQLGNGVTLASFVPVAVSTTAFGAGERVVRVSTGSTGLHSLGIVAMPLASGGAPVVSTNAAESINKTSATLKGLVNPGGTATTAWFEYGLTTSYGSLIPVVPQSVGSGSTSQTFTQSLTGLEPNTPYHFRIIASNTNGTVTGDDFSFTTLPDPPLAVTTSANTITNTTATLTGTVNPTGRATTIYFEFGTTTLYGNTTAPQNIAAGSSNVNVIAPVSGLTLGTTYHFRLVAQNSAGTAYGDDVAFMTTSISSPVLGSLSASDMTTTSATLNGSVNPNGAITTAWFEYGLTNSYTGITSVTGFGAVTSPQPVSLPVTSLTPATTYHYRLVAQNSAGTTQGAADTFTTLPLPPIVETHAAAALSTTSARLNGKVNAQNGSAVVTFEWGTDGVSFPNSLTAVPSPVTGSALTDVSVDLANLAQFTTYHFRVKAVSAGGTTTGSVLTFQPAIISGLTQQFPGAPPASSGTLTVSMLSSTGAPAWRLWGEKQWRASGSSATGLTTGDRNVEFLPIAGMASPAAPPVPVTAGGPPALLEREYFSTPVAGSGGFTVRLRPESITTGLDRAQWRLVGESDAQWRDDDTSLSALPAGSYLLECKPVPGRDTPGVTTHEVVAGSSPTITLWYPAASTQTGTPPSPLLLADLSDNTKPYAYVGQIRSDRGLSTGFVVNDRVIATAAHVVFDDVLLATAPGLQWLHRRHAGALDPVPMIPRGYYLRDGYAAQRQTEPVPGVSSLATQNLDVAALYFSVSEFPADGAYGGYLASDLTNNEFLLSSAPKMLVGYPIDGIASAFQGIMHATPAANITFTKTFERVYSSSGIRSSGGNSGGPLFVQHTNGKWYPAAIYLGSSGQAVVRALDSDVIRLFDAAHYTGSTNNLETSGGITQTNVTGSLSVTSDGAIRVFITPAAAVSANARWNLNGATSNGKGSGSSQGGIKHNSVVTINFTTVSGFQAPTTQNVTITGGQTTTITFEYAPSETPQETWRNAYFGTTANSGNAADTFDFDGDGFTNAQEYAAGTNPTLSGDFFKVTDSQRTVSTFTASTAGKAGRTYTLQRSTNLNSWTAVGSPQGPLSSDAVVTLQDVAMPNDAAFYRIVVTGP